MSILVEVIAIIVGTFASEDLTCLSVGLLSRDGRLPLSVGLPACLAGIILGDAGLWLIGRLVGRPVLAWPWLRRRLPAGSVDQWEEWFRRRGWLAVAAARCAPGLRMPLFLAAGALGVRGGTFALTEVL